MQRDELLKFKLKYGGWQESEKSDLNPGGPNISNWIQLRETSGALGCPVSLLGLGTKYKKKGWRSNCQGCLGVEAEKSKMVEKQADII